MVAPARRRTRWRDARGAAADRAGRDCTLGRECGTRLRPYPPSWARSDAALAPAHWPPGPASCSGRAFAPAYIHRRGLRGQQPPGADASGALRRSPGRGPVADAARPHHRLRRRHSAVDVALRSRVRRPHDRARRRAPRPHGRSAHGALLDCAGGLLDLEIVIAHSATALFTVTLHAPTVNAKNRRNEGVEEEIEKIG